MVSGIVRTSLYASSLEGCLLHQGVLLLISVTLSTYSLPLDYRRMHSRNGRWQYMTRTQHQGLQSQIKAYCGLPDCQVTILSSFRHNRSLSRLFYPKTFITREVFMILLQYPLPSQPSFRSMLQWRMQRHAIKGKSHVKMPCASSWGTFPVSEPISQLSGLN